ncbi:MAG: SPOR domain-containing protein [Bacteroidota bacterium]
MNKYLLQILHEVNTIIIPGLGALTVTNSKTGEIMFMSFLKHDDGKLAKYISDNDGISENDAKNLIAKYVREILAQLDKGDSYDMYQFGRFIKVNGEVEFENWNKYNNTEVNSENIINETPIVETETKVIELVQEAKIEIIPLQEKIEIVPEVEKVEDVPTIKAEESPKAPNPIAIGLDEILGNSLVEENTIEESIIEKLAVEEAKSETSTSSVPDNSSSSVSQSEQLEKPEQIEKITEEKIVLEKPIPAKTVVKKPEPKQKASVKKEKVVKEHKKRGAGFWVLMIVVFLLVGGGISSAIFYDKIEKLFSSKTEVKNELDEEVSDENLEKIENQVELEEESSIEENAKKELSETIEETEKTESSEPVKETLTQIQPQTTNSGLSYHIISGGFGVEANANRQAEKFKSEGKNSSVLGKFDNLYLVAYESFATKEEANTALKTAGVKGWIFNYQKK